MKNSTSFKKLFVTLVVTFFAKTYLAQQWDGLTYYSIQNTTVGYLLDTNSVAVKTWNFTGGTGYSTHMMPGGTLFRSVLNQGNVLTGGGMTGRIQKVDYSGTILWDYTYSSATYCMHHDICPLPNGNVLVISYDVKTATDATNAGASLSSVVWSEKIMELQPAGSNGANVVWEWKLWDHLVQNVNQSAANYQASIVNNPQLLNINYSLQKDWIHMNGVDYNPVLDQIVLSSHAINEWYVIDHSTTTAEAASHAGGNAGKGGDFLYRWGNPAAYSATGTKILNVTHDAHWIPEDCANGGNLAGINNRGVSNPNKTTADQAIIPRNGYNYTITPGSAYSPASYSARQVGVGYTTNMGSSQEFPNGNQLICLATIGTIYEINSAGTTLWTKTTGGSTAQSKRYTQCFIDNPAPPQPTISATGDLLSSTAATTYQWYRNGTIIAGATSQTYLVTQSGIYVVKTTDFNTCVYVYSAGFTHTVTVPPVNETGISENSLNLEATIYPNPTTGEINIHVDAQNYTVFVSDNTGKQILQEQNTAKLDLSYLSNGLYILSIITSEGASTNKKITILK